MELTPRQRLTRLAGGIALLVVAFAIYSISKRHDPKNRAALVAIVAALMGASWIGQGLRGRTEAAPNPEAPPRGEPVSAGQTVAGILGAWLFPGLGHWIIGRKGKAILIAVTILATFVIGALLGHGRVFHYERDGVYYLAYMFCALPTGIAWLIAGQWELDHTVPHLQLGFLYTAVACLLNLVVIMDFLATCTASTDAAHDKDGSDATTASPALDVTGAPGDAGAADGENDSRGDPGRRDVEDGGSPW